MNTPKANTDTRKAHVTVRMPADLRKRIEEEAAREHRSITQQMVYLLEQSMERKAAREGAPDQVSLTGA